MTKPTEIALGVGREKLHKPVTQRELHYTITVKDGCDHDSEAELTKKQLDRLRADIMALGRDGINGESFTIGGPMNTIVVACKEVVS